jgi:hypothetical protein
VDEELDVDDDDDDDDNESNFTPATGNSSPNEESTSIPSLISFVSLPSTTFSIRDLHFVLPSTRLPFNSPPELVRVPLG